MNTREIYGRGREGVKHDVVCGIAARGKIKKELNKNAKEIYNNGGMLVEFSEEKVYNTGIFKFV